MLKVLLSKKIGGIIIRHAMTALGAWLVANGYADPATDAAALETIGGAGAALTGLIWSAMEKKGRA